MQKLNSYKIYNASAGSGKTYTLVKDYLALLLKNKQADAYRNILAITFTNKAVAEMKTRVISALNGLSKEECPPGLRSLMNDLLEHTGYSEESIRKKSQKVLKSILHNYASFDISTIDRFTHKIIRTFAKDLGIPVNFEVELNTLQVLEEAVDRLINRAGEDKDLTMVLVNFTLLKTDDDKSWDIARDLLNFSRILLHENHIPYVNVLRNKTLQDYQNFSEKIKTAIATTEESIKIVANNFFRIVESHELDRSCFNRGYVYDYFSKLKEGNLKVAFGAKWQENIGEEKLYSAKVLQINKDCLDRYQPEIALLFQTTRAAIFRREFLKEILKNLTPLSLLGQIAREMEEIKKEKSLVLISDFNPTIESQVKGQPAPFIYERLGERYRNYFIDEFQDTSEMQWNNIIPLIDHALSSETQLDQPAGLTLVGDAKQSIYRFRGGKAEQFIDLYNGNSPFSIKEDVTNLPYNYRSAKEIVDFNNSFFRYISGKFHKPEYRDLFENSGQTPKKETPGYINISFLETDNAEHEMELHPEKVYEIILDLEKKGTAKSDICILTRTRKQSFAVANYLSGKGISIVSSESLLVSNSPEVNFINNLLEFSVDSEDLNLRWKILNYLTERLEIKEPHDLISVTLRVSKDNFFKWLKELDINFNIQQVRELSLYEAAEYIIRSFSLIERSDAYLQSYLDFIFEKSTKSAISVTTFIEYWEQYREKLSIVAPKTSDAVQIMTIHTSKGLEFPVVIYPFANTKICDVSKENLWLPLPEEFSEIPVGYFKATKKMLEWGDYAAAAYQNLLHQTEFDAINILYVALTRASQKLYILSCYELKNGEECEEKISGLLIGYLKSQNLWTGDFNYEIGKNLPAKGKEAPLEARHPEKFYSSSTQNQIVKIVTRSGSLWGSSQEEAINVGILIHNILSDINTAGDIPEAIKKHTRNRKPETLSREELEKEIYRIITHPKVAPYYSNEAVVYRERDIIKPNGEVLRPDRLNFNGDQVTIIDYKTGKPQLNHKEQMAEYAAILEAMEFVVDKKILIYINEEVNIVVV